MRCPRARPGAWRGVPGPRRGRVSAELTPPHGATPLFQLLAVMNRVLEQLRVWTSVLSQPGRSLEAELLVLGGHAHLSRGRRPPPPSLGRSPPLPVVFSVFFAFAALGGIAGSCGGFSPVSGGPLGRGSLVSVRAPGVTKAPVWNPASACAAPGT